MNFRSFIFTGDKTLCTGCGACAQICAYGAIKMKSDDEGFLFPVLDNDKCIQCGACEKTCPMVGSLHSNSEQEQHCYVATTNEEKYYKESASIGVCTMLSEVVVNQGGVVFGSFLDERDWTAYHIPVYDWDGVKSIRNSKYLQSDTKRTFSEVRNLLKKDVLVLYIGTPCQIAGLKSFLKKDYSTLFTIDIICHGVFSPKLMPLEISYWERMFHGKVSSFRFRSKQKYTRVNGGMVNFDVKCQNGRKRHIERHASSSPTYRAFAYSGDGINHVLRLSCYCCPFRSQQRYADITVGDPWRIKDSVLNNKRLQSNNCIRSLFSSNTSKGKALLKNVLDKMQYQEIARVDAFVQPAIIQTHRIDHGQRDIIFKRINSENYASIIEDVFNCNLEKAHISFKKKYYIHYIKYLIRKIIKFR